MEKMKATIGKILLLFVLSFVLHDYIVGQSMAIDRAEKIEKIKNSIHHIGSLCEIHQVFHSPALVTDTTPAIYAIAKASPEQKEEPLLAKRDPFIPYTPPKQA